ncbi:MAG: hypothetical protein ABFD46_09325 [Armatimonadota bacterium]
MSGYSKIIVILALIAVTAALAVPAVADGWDFKSQVSSKGNPNEDIMINLKSKAANVHYTVWKTSHVSTPRGNNIQIALEKDGGR